MSQPIQIFASADAVFQPAPIPADWVLAGTPTATVQQVFRSADRRSFTMLWHCTAGSFRWIYNEDETVQVLDGGMTLHLPDGTERACVAGDLVFFPGGTVCTWVIADEVRKLAFLREAPPPLLGFVIRAIGKLRRIAGSGSGSVLAPG